MYVIYNEVSILTTGRFCRLFSWWCTDTLDPRHFGPSKLRS